MLDVTVAVSDESSIHIALPPTFASDEGLWPDSTGMLREPVSDDGAAATEPPAEVPSKLALTPKPPPALARNSGEKDRRCVGVCTGVMSDCGSAVLTPSGDSSSGAGDETPLETPPNAGLISTVGVSVGVGVSPRDGPAAALFAPRAPPDCDLPDCDLRRRPALTRRGLLPLRVPAPVVVPVVAPTEVPTPVLLPRRSRDAGRDAGGVAVALDAATNGLSQPTELSRVRVLAPTLCRRDAGALPPPPPKPPATMPPDTAVPATAPPTSLLPPPVAHALAAAAPTPLPAPPVPPPTDLRPLIGVVAAVDLSASRAPALETRAPPA
jgi:hypothetical protein